jgi:hypothetical protein
MLQKLNFNVYVDFADALYVLMVSLPLESDGKTTAETHQMMDLVTKKARTPGPPVLRSPSSVWEALPAGFGTSGASGEGRGGRGAGGGRHGGGGGGGGGGSCGGGGVGM